MSTAQNFKNMKTNYKFGSFSTSKYSASFSAVDKKYSGRHLSPYVYYRQKPYWQLITWSGHARIRGGYFDAAANDNWRVGLELLMTTVIITGQGCRQNTSSSYSKDLAFYSARRVFPPTNDALCTENLNNLIQNFDSPAKSCV